MVVTVEAIIVKVFQSSRYPSLIHPPRRVTPINRMIESRELQTSQGDPI